MHSLMGERLLRQFLGNIRHRKNGDATSEANDGKTADRPDGRESEGIQEKREDASQHPNGRREE
jgi:hypothetical protein